MILSILGNVFVASVIQKNQVYGYTIWIISNIIWVYYFAVTTQYSSLALFIAYLSIAIYAVYNRVKPVKNNWDTNDTYWVD